MKTNIQITGTVELSKKDLLEAINQHLQSTQNLSVKRIQYTNGMDTILCEVYQEIGDDEVQMKFLNKTPEKRKTGGYKKKYFGFFDTARTIFDEQRKAKRKQITLDDFVAEVQFHFPGMEKTRVAQYLHDKRQLKNVSYDSSKKIITLS